MIDKKNNTNDLMWATTDDEKRVFTFSELINFAKFVWYTKSLSDTTRGLSHYYCEWKEMGFKYKD
jgi:hypothetical protein